MRTNKLFITILLICLMTAGFLFTGCDMLVANSELNGKWLAFGGLSLEFTNGTFTRTLPGGEVQTGTYTTNELDITFHIKGSTSETLPYTLAFPRLIVGGTTYYHDSPRLPDDMEGLWFGYYSLYSNQWWVPLKFGTAKPQRDNPWVLEGRYEAIGRIKGDYFISARNLPNQGVFTMNTTHTAGAALASFIRYRLRTDLMVLFDWETLDNPESEYWWFTEAEARKFFTDAAQRARQMPDGIALESLVLMAMNSFLSGMNDPEIFDYTLEKDIDYIIVDYWGEEVEGDTVLTFREGGGAIITFVKAKEEDWAFGLWDNNIALGCTNAGISGVLCCRSFVEEN